VSDVDVLRKIISILPHDKYAFIITVFDNMEDWSIMTPPLSLEKYRRF